MSRLLHYYAPCALGIEPALVSELEALGARQVASQPGGVAFDGDRALGYAACLWLRSAIRVQEVLAEFAAPSSDALYGAVADLPWERWMRVDQTLAVDASVRDSALTHSGFAALVVKDAIVDRFRAASSRRPSVDRRRPTLPLKLVLKRDRAQLSRDLAGASLHKRGYRPIQVKSPLNEALAAGLLLLAGWDRRTALADPMCGSGTFLIEAALLAADRAPGLRRSFAFERWPDLDAAAWSALRADAEARARDAIDVSIAGADAHAGALSIARQAAERAGVAALVSLEQCSAAQWVPPVPPGFVITNPPYGERLGAGGEAEAAWDELARFLRGQCAGAAAHVLSGHPALTRRLGLRASRRWPVRNGPIDCRLLRYEVFARAPGPGAGEHA